MAEVLHAAAMAPRSERVHEERERRKDRGSGKGSKARREREGRKTIEL